MGKHLPEYHTPVMLSEVLDFLIVRSGGVYIDCTLGGGGYSEAMLQRLQGAEEFKVFGFDTDPDALEYSTERLRRFGNRFEAIPENFGRIAEAMMDRNITAVDGIVYDLGVSGHQLDTGSIGLSYRVDALLDMRFDPRQERTAKDIVNGWSEQELKQIFYRYGEEPYAGPIAREIVKARKVRKIETTFELRDSIAKVMRADKVNQTLSRIFQALRIEVNDELNVLRQSIQASVHLLRAGGRIVVVSYHSLEDRIVKDFFSAESTPPVKEGSLESLREHIDRSRITLEVLTRKPMTATSEEIERNTRARSAKLRAAEKV